MRQPAAAATAFALAVLAGHVLDRTTGQPLAGVHVESGAVHATTDKSGRFALRGVPAGVHTVTLESNDVPLQRVQVTVGSRSTDLDLRACSTTLDYNCGGPATPPGASSGAS